MVNREQPHKKKLAYNFRSFNELNSLREIGRNPHLNSTIDKEQIVLMSGAVVKCGCSVTRLAVQELFRLASEGPSNL
jgi:hypothetical protein